MALVVFYLFIFLFVAVGVFSWFLYGTQVLPSLGESVGFLPSSRYRQIERYLKLEEEAGATHWYLPYLRRIELIETLMVFLSFVVFGLVIFGKA